MSITSDIQLLQPMQIVELFRFDATALGDSQVYNWHPGTTVSGTAIKFGGVTYIPFPVNIEGFDLTTNEKLPRPRLQVANINGAFSAYLRQYGGGIGAKVTRFRTLGKYLDAANFPGGNPDADPTAKFPDDVFYVSRKTDENPIFIEIELASKWDVTGVMLPRRQVIASVCQWVYRSAECSYTGGAVEDINGNKPGSAGYSGDDCNKTLDACKGRFPNAPLRTSAFPASLLSRQ